MKKAIRIIDGIFALCLIVIYSFVAFGNFALPNNIKAYQNKAFIRLKTVRFRKSIIKTAAK